MSQDRANANPSVLIVEDDPLSLYMMEELCASLGMDVSSATSGTACLRALDADPNQFDVVLMDIHMPGQSGADVAKRIRACSEHPPRDIPIVAVTADPHWQDADLQKANGIDAYLPKPVDAGALNDMCRRWLH